MHLEGGCQRAFQCAPLCAPMPFHAPAQILRTNANSLSVHSPTMDEQTWFWPSMIVSASREMLRRAKWTTGTFRSTYVGQEATVVRVHAAQALVRWLAAAPVVGAEVAIEPPQDMQRPSRLIELHQHHARSCWRLGEHAWLKPEDCARLLEEDPKASGSKKPHKKKKAAVENCIEVLSCHTRVDVIWQDGTREMDSAATSLAPAKHVDGYYEFWPQDFIVGRAAVEGTGPVGVVDSVNHDERICVVTWRADSRREVLPVYDIAPHPDFNFKVGDVVLRLPATSGPHGGGPGDSNESEAPAAAPAHAPPAHGSSGEGEAMAAEATAPPPVLTAAAAAGAGNSNDEEDAEGEEGADGGARNSSALGYIGEVVVIGPRLTVKWMDGTLSTVPPEELYVVNTDEDEEPVDELDEQSYDEDEDEPHVSSTVADLP